MRISMLAYDPDDLEWTLDVYLGPRTPQTRDDPGDPGEVLIEGAVCEDGRLFGARDVERELAAVGFDIGRLIDQAREETSEW